MLGNGELYTVKKRKRPVQKSCGLETKHDDATKSNPSKRHRDRLNGELGKLTALLPLPEEVRARLDKLSVLRLSVGYLKIKNYFTATLRKNSGPEFFCNDDETTASLAGIGVSKADLLLQALNGFVLVVSTDGSIFYASPTIQDYLGFHQSDVVHQSVFDLIHIDDRVTFSCQLHFALDPESSIDGPAGSERIPPENSSFLERSFCCRLRCLLDNSSGFLALNFQGRLKYLHRQDRTTEGKASGLSELALFAIAIPVQPPAILEIRTKTLFFQTKHKLDFTPVGMDTRGKVVLGYTEQELCMRGSGYQFIHAADMMYCADKHLRMMKTGESGFSIFRLLSKTGVWIWVQANARMVLKAGKPDFIICHQKPLTNEEGEEHLRQRQLQLPFNFATGEALLYETFPSLMIPGLQDHPSSTAVHPDSLLGSLLSQDRSVYNRPPEPASHFSLKDVFMDSHALLSVPNSIRWDFTSQAMPDSPDMDGVLKEQLKEKEEALLQLQEEDPIQLSDILANDVFSYVEDALLRETSARGISQNMLNGPTSQSDTTGRQQNSVLPGNPIMRCEYSSSHSQKLTESDFYGQKAPERECTNDSLDLFGTLKSFPHPPNSCSSIPGHFSIPFHNNHSSSIEKTGMVLSDPSQNNPLSQSVPGRPFSVNIQHAIHQGTLPPWQPQQHAVPLNLQRSHCVQNGFITHNPPVSQHPQDIQSQTELCSPYTMNRSQRSHISQNSSLSSSSYSYQRCTLSSNEPFSELHIPGSMDTDCSCASCPGTSGLSHY